MVLVIGIDDLQWAEPLLLDLTEHLVARGYSADKLHGDMSQAIGAALVALLRSRS